jgi:hypothetical protein
MAGTGNLTRVIGSQASLSGAQAVKAAARQNSDLGLSRPSGRTHREQVLLLSRAEVLLAVSDSLS